MCCGGTVQVTQPSAWPGKQSHALKSPLGADLKWSPCFCILPSMSTQPGFFFSQSSWVQLVGRPFWQVQWLHLLLLSSFYNLPACCFCTCRCCNCHPVQYISPSGALQSFGGIQLALFCDFTRLPTLFLVLPGEELRTSWSSVSMRRCFPGRRKASGTIVKK